MLGAPRSERSNELRYGDLSAAIKNPLSAFVVVQSRQLTADGRVIAAGLIESFNRVRVKARERARIVNAGVPGLQVRCANTSRRPIVYLTALRGQQS